MPIKYRVGDMFEGPERVIVHGCNAQGVMGSGVAKIVRERFPSAYENYRKQFQHSGLRLGSIVWSDGWNEKLVGNLITQEFYGRDGKRYVSYAAITEAFKNLNLAMKAASGWNGDTVAMPLIGAGLAGGDWKIISDIISKEATEFHPVVYVLEKHLIPSWATADDVI